MYSGCERQQDARAARRPALAREQVEQEEERGLAARRQADVALGRAASRTAPRGTPRARREKPGRRRAPNSSPRSGRTARRLPRFPTRRCRYTLSTAGMRAGLPPPSMCMPAHRLGSGMPRSAISSSAPVERAMRRPNLVVAAASCRLAALSADHVYGNAMGSVQAIIFDLDNTLWDVGPVILRAEHALLDFLRDRYPRVTSATTCDSMRGAARADRARTSRDGSRFHLAAARIAAAPCRGVRLRASRWPRKRSRSSSARATKSCCTTTCARRSTGSRARTVCSRSATATPTSRVIGLDDYFEANLSAREAGMLKPDPRIFDMLLQRSGLRAARGRARRRRPGGRRRRRARRRRAAGLVEP